MTTFEQEYASFQKKLKQVEEHPENLVRVVFVVPPYRIDFYYDPPTRSMCGVYSDAEGNFRHFVPQFLPN